MLPSDENSLSTSLSLPRNLDTNTRQTGAALPSAGCRRDFEEQDEVLQSQTPAPLMVIRDGLVFLGKFEGSLNGVGRTSGSQTEPGSSELRVLSGLEVRHLSILSVYPALSVVPALSEAQCITRP